MAAKKEIVGSIFDLLEFLVQREERDTATCSPVCLTGYADLSDGEGQRRG